MEVGTEPMGTVHGMQPHIWGPFYTRKPGSSTYVNSNPDQLTTHRSSPEKTESYMIYTCCCPMSWTTETWKTNLIRSQIINNFWRKRTIQAQKLDLNVRLQKLLSTDLFPGQPCALAVFLHLLCMHDKAINRALDKDWVLGRRNPRRQDTARLMRNHAVI